MPSIALRAVPEVVDAMAAEYEAGASGYALSVKYKFDESHIGVLLRRNGVKMRKRGREPRSVEGGDDAIRAYYAAGHTQRETREHFCISYARVSKALRGVS